MSLSQSITLLPLSWERIHQDSQALAVRLSGAGPFSRIVAITRGGLVPAAILSRELDIRMVDTLCISTYDDRDPGPPQVLKSLDGDGDGWLVVDDLADSGATLRLVRTLLPRAHLATLYVKPAGKTAVDDFVGEFDQSIWIGFPWDAGGKS